MVFEKCPRCELNYILDGGKLCSVCRKEVCGESEQDDLPEMCSECGENPAVPGGELCLNCLKEIALRTPVVVSEDVILVEDPALQIDSVSNMDEIELELADGEAFDDDDDFDDDEDELLLEDDTLPLEDDEDDILPEDDYGDDDPRNR